MTAPQIAPFVTPGGFVEILEHLSPQTPIFLQALRLEGVLQPAFFTTSGRALHEDEMTALAELAALRGRTCTVR